MKQRTLDKSLSLYFPITRTEKTPEGVLAEGYCYVNAKVGDGFNLLRQTMMDMTPDYMEYGNIREMHGPSAVGTANPSLVDGDIANRCGIEWDEKGAFLRALIVDTEAAKKVSTGVYKGFSVGVRPLVMRGEDVLKGKWGETSLVDRPADPDAKCVVARADFTEQAFTVDILEAGDSVERAAPKTFKQNMMAEKFYREASSQVYSALNMLERTLYDIASSESDGKEELVRKSIAQFADLVAPLMGSMKRGELELLAVARQSYPALIAPNTGEGDVMERADIARALKEDADLRAEIGRIYTEHSAPQLTRLESIEATIAKVPDTVKEAAESALKPVIERLEKMENGPAPVRMPLATLPAGSTAVERLIGDPAASEEDVATKTIARYKELSGKIEAEKDDRKRANLVSTRSIVRAELNSLGIDHLTLA